MHIKRQGCGWASLRQLLRGEGIAQQAHAPSSQLFGDIQGVEPCLAQESIVFDRISRFTVMQGSARRKVLCQVPTALPQAYVLLSDLKVHASPPSRVLRPGCDMQSALGHPSW